LIGSAQGDKYRKFVQALTLEQLLQLANQELERLMSRYQLAIKTTAFDPKRAINTQLDDGLEMAVVDRWQADSQRDTRTLSGGERFVVSLALALALSQIASQNSRIDTLFLDEGFGSLDQESLDVVLDALDHLQDRGKLIGVISHVEAMRQRIPVQIAVSRQSQQGWSKLLIHPSSEQ
jgi:DNA repair protein SbcC/Rad50